MTMNRAFRQLAFYAFLIGCWQLVTHLQIWPNYLLPSPWSVCKALYQGLAEGHYWLGIAASLKRLLIGYVLSVGIGVALGFTLAHSRWLQDCLGSMILGLQTLPSVCWLPLALLWFGLNDRAIIFVVVIGSVLSIALATQAGIRQVPRIFVQSGMTLGARGLRLYLHVILPAAFPSIFEGMKQGWSFAWRSLMGGELLFVSIGIGHLLNMGRELNDLTEVLAVMSLIVGIGLVTDKLIFSSVEKRIAARWGFARR
jgi:NitT/TauT family transport system permease protein